MRVHHELRMLADPAASPELRHLAPDKRQLLHRGLVDSREQLLRAMGQAPAPTRLLQQPRRPRLIPLDIAWARPARLGGGTHLATIPAQDRVRVGFPSRAGNMQTPESTPMKMILRALALLAFIALALLGLAACAHVDPSIVNPSKVYRDAPVEKSKLAISIRPKSKLNDAPTVLMYPFWVSQKMDNHMLVGRELARLVHQTWTEEAAFETLMFDPQLVYRGPEQAVSVARAAGADLVVVGIVPYLYTGGSIDSTAVTLQVRIYETKGGNLLLSMEQAARVNARLPQDWIFFDLNTRLSDSPLTEAIASIAHDMAVPIKSWMPPTDEEMGFADSSSGMIQGILSGGSPLSGPDYSDGSRGMVAGLLDTAGQGGKGARGFSKSLKLKVEFDVDSSHIRPESYTILNELAKALKSDALKGRRVVIAGHCDSDASLEYNQKLSERRSDAVKAYLVERGGVAAQSMRTEGYGKTRPLVPNTSKANKQRNRRVEVRLDN